MAERLEGEHVLVTDGHERSAFAACRGLACAGFVVSATTLVRPAAAELSRSVTSCYSISDPQRDGDAFVHRLAEILEAHPHAVLLPGTEPSLLRISEQRDVLERYVRIGLPAHDVVLGALDRSKVAAAATRAGMEPPQTVECADEAEALRAATRLGYPVVVKPRRSALRTGDGRMRTRPSRVVGDQTTLRALLPSFGLPVAVQQHAQGSVVSLGGLVAGGDLTGLCVSRYRRTWPPQGGSASFTETFAPGAVLTQGLERILDELRWEGLFELEVIEVGDDRYSAIDFNPRPYGSMVLAVAAGANLPALWCAHVLGRTSTPVRASPGFHYRWEEAEARNFLWSVRRRRLRAALAVLRPSPNTTHAFFRLTDPAPILARPLALLMRPVRRARRAAGFS